MEKQEKRPHRQGLTDMLRRRRDPGGDLPFDPDGDEPLEDGETP